MSRFLPTLFLLACASAWANPVAPTPAEAKPVRVPKGKRSEVGKDVRVIPIDDSRVNKIYRIRTSPGIPAVIEFPEGFAAPPSCGDCLDAAAPLEARQGSPALFSIQVFNDQNYLAVKPRQYARSGGGSIPDDEFLTTVTVRLASKLTLTLQVEYAPRNQADARVVFTLPNRSTESQYVQEQVAKAKAEMEGQFAQRISAGTTQAFLSSLLEPHLCVGSSARARSDDVVVEVRELCRFGTKVFIRFSVENRSRNSLALGELEVKKKRGRELVQVDDLNRVLTTQEVPFGTIAHGVVGFELNEGEEPGKSYELKVAENGGRGRSVVLDDFGF